MAMSSMVRRRAAWLTLLGLACATASVQAASGSTQHHYILNGSLSLASGATPASGGGLTMRSKLSSLRVGIPVQSGGQLALMARLALSPTVCYADTIFADGFE